MALSLSTLLEQLTLQQKSDGVLTGHCDDFLRSGRIFGGFVLGQALMASTSTVSTERPLHSMHAYFIRPGDTTAPIQFKVETMRNGGSFSVRRVVALQQDIPIFSASCSFQTPEEGFEHSPAMPSVALPDDSVSELAFFDQIGDSLNAPSIKALAHEERPFEVRYPNTQGLLAPGYNDPEQFIWFKANGHVPNDPLLHQSALAFFSDYHFLLTALRPHNRWYLSPNLQLASLDHAMWFHRPVNVNDWLLYCMQSPVAIGGRGLTQGQIFNQEGELVASTVQEGLMRERLGSKPLMGKDPL